MNATELATLSMSEIKSFCTSHAIEVVGDKRAKSTYILAIETFQSEQTVIEIIEMPAIPDPFESQFELAIETEPVDLPPVPTTQHHGAAIVMLTPLILLSVALIAIRIGIGALIPLIAAVGRLLVSIGRSITGTDRAIYYWYRSRYRLDPDSERLRQRLFPRMKPHFWIANGHY